LRGALVRAVVRRTSPRLAVLRDLPALAAAFFGTGEGARAGAFGERAGAAGRAGVSGLAPSGSGR
jgi:hypothetical protein